MRFRSKIKKKYPKYYKLLSLGVFLFLGVGYSVIDSKLGIDGTVTASKNNWDIYFDHVDYPEGNVTATTPVTITGKYSLSFAVNLTNPGDKYEFTFDIINDSSLDAIIKSIEKTSLTEQQAKYIDYSITYLNGEEVSTGDLLKKNETKKVHVLVKYKNLRGKDYYPTTDDSTTLTLGINYYQPRDAKYSVLVKQGSSDLTYKVTNLEQQITLDDIVLESTDKIIACNNGAFATTDSEGIITINNIKNDVSCRLESDLNTAITNSYNEKTNILLLSDNAAGEKFQVSSTQDIMIDLNGKVYTFLEGTATEACSTINGTLAVKDSKTGGGFNSIVETLMDVSQDANLTINGGTYTRTYVESTDGAVIKISGGNVQLKNGIFTSDDATTLSVNGDNTKLNISNCTVTSGNRVLTSSGNNVEINIRDNTTLTAVNPISINKVPTSDVKTKLFICNSTITNSSNVDVDAMADKAMIFYSSNTIFTDTTNTPVLASSTNNKQVINSSIACGE